MGLNPSDEKGRELPVDTVSQNDAQEFCQKASSRTGQSVRLPTEAEWEYACRAGTRTAYCTGDTQAALDDTAWHIKNSGCTIHAVGQKIPNAWGLYDTHGNVAEWCADWEEEYAGRAVVDPQGPSQGTHRIIRGGSCGDDAKNCRSADRSSNSPGRRTCDFGLRAAMSLPQTP
jgi:formylglycine-generating enzyme required for sulfatase activity